MKTRRAIVVGFDYYAKFLTSLVNEHSQTWSLQTFRRDRYGTIRALMALRRANALISFGGPAPTAALVEAARMNRVPIIVIWAGSDVTRAAQDPFKLELVKQEHFHHISDGPWLVDELERLGLHVEYEPVTAVRPGNPVRPFPARFNVLTYLPEPRRDFYGADLVFQVARRMPDATFTVVGNGAPSPDAPRNVAFLGYVKDMERTFDESCVLLRVPQHDGKSMLVLEALTRARHVIWNYEFPHVTTMRTADEIVSELRRLQLQHQNGKLMLNDAGRAFALENFSRPLTAERFERRLNQVVERFTAPLPRHRSVAISGLRLFCGDVAGYAQAFTPEWEPHLLHTGSRLEVLTSITGLRQCDVWYTIGDAAPDRWLQLAARLFRKPRVVHWVGSDITRLTENPKLRAALASENVLHLAEVEWTAGELQSAGLPARIAPLPPRRCSEPPMALPKDFTVLLYVPAVRSDFYGRKEFERLMQRLRDKPIRYIVVGGGDIDAPPGVEVENLRWYHDLYDVYKRTSVLIRYTRRDGLSLMVLEALSFGRHVLWTQDFMFSRSIRRYEDMEREVVALFDAHQAGELHPQNEAAAIMQERYAPERCMRTISRAWEDALQEPLPGILAARAQ